MLLYLWRIHALSGSLNIQNVIGHSGKRLYLWDYVVLSIVCCHCVNSSGTSSAICIVLQKSDPGNEETPKQQIENIVKQRIVSVVSYACPVLHQCTG